MSSDLSRLNRLCKQQEEIYHQWAKKAGITDTQFWVLYALCEVGKPLSQNTFCENWCYSKQTVSTAVANLEADGLLRLDYAEGSRKQKNITLTEAGEAFCDGNIRTLMQAESAALTGLDKEEREIFFKVFERFLFGIEQTKQ